MTKFLSLPLLFASILALVTSSPAAWAEGSAACDEARPMAMSWLRLTTYLEKLEQGGWSEAEIAYVDDAVRERESDLHDVGKVFERGTDPADKSLGTSLGSLHTEIAKREGRDLVDFLDEGRLAELVTALERVSVRCPAPKATEGDEEDAEGEEEGEGAEGASGR